MRKKKRYGIFVSFNWYTDSGKAGSGWEALTIGVHPNSLTPDMLFIIQDDICKKYGCDRAIIISWQQMNAGNTA